MPAAPRLEQPEDRRAISIETVEGATAEVIGAVLRSRADPERDHGGTGPQ